MHPLLEYGAGRRVRFVVVTVSVDFVPGPTSIPLLRYGLGSTIVNHNSSSSRSWIIEIEIRFAHERFGEVVNVENESHTLHFGFVRVHYLHSVAFIVRRAPHGLDSFDVK